MLYHNSNIISRLPQSSTYHTSQGGEDKLSSQPKRIRLYDPDESDSESDDDPSGFDPNEYYNTATQDTTAKCVSDFIDVAFK